MKKIRNKKGFTLTEMLISVMLLGFVTLMATVMTSAILNTNVSMRETAQAEILGNEALDNLQDRLRFAQHVTVKQDDGSLMFDLDAANTGYAFSVDEEGKIVMEHEKDGEKMTEPLFAGVSYGNLRVSDLLFSRDGEKKTIKISVEISYGEKMLWNGSVSVKPLNGISTV